MAEEPAGSSWRLSCLGCAGVSLVFIGVVFFAIAVDQRDFDPADVCGRGESGECLSTETGVIESTEIFFDDVRVAYDDGRKTIDVLLDDEEEPAVGTRVVLEWWDGDVVALVDRQSGRRYKTTNWPDPWWEWLAVFGTLVAVAGVAVGVVFGIVGGVRRLLGRRQAARSNGNP